MPFQLEFVLEEILGYSDTARDYVIAILAMRNGYHKEISKSGPLISHQRSFYDCYEF